MDDNNGDLNLDFNSLNNLRYMEKVIKEAIRLWGINFFDRTCTKDYYIPELNYTVPKGKSYFRIRIRIQITARVKAKLGLYEKFRFIFLT